MFGGGFSSYFGAAPPNSVTPDCAGSIDRGFGLLVARSGHPGGVNAALADGSVRWFSNTIAISLWRALSTRDGGEIVSNY
jgi:prepilin-type processing-associated H-X9-DG protein